MTNHSRGPRGRRAFSLLELIVMIALLGLMAALFITGASDLFRSRQRTMADVFWDAVQAARLQAIQQDTVVTLRFDEKTRQILWGATGEPHAVSWPGRNLEFLPADTRNTILLGGQLVDTGRLARARFYADGTTDRFRVQLTDAEGRVSQLELDPWTAAPIVRIPQ